jgi:AP-3 complex subunit delta-1
MDMRERLRPFGISFEKSLEDLIKGIRATNNDQEKLQAFFDKSIQECKTELKSTDLDLKSTAILKLAYLEMYGFDMSWCSFSILEVMASQKFQHKRIGYLAAIQILQRQNNDDALMLMTNLLKKDLNSTNYAETSLAISGIAAVVSKDLALDLCDDIAKMLTHSKPLIRKKAVLAMYKIFLKNPEALRIYYERIVSKLDDSDSSVVSATVNVICELAYMNPSNYIELAPRLYNMLQDSKNNWMVIRLLKLFSSLSLIEPRLKNKLLPEITELMKSTKALSLVYECINAILNGNMLAPEDIETAHLIIEKLLIFFESDDQNLKYVGLLAFIKTCKIHKDLIKQHDKIILTSVYDNDITIRETSLEIVNSLVSENNIVAIVTRLMVQLLPFKEQQEHLNEINKKINKLDRDDDNADNNDNNNDYENENFNIGLSQQPIVVSDKYKFLLINKIIEICSMNNYENIPNFKWYLKVLNDILKLNSINKLSNVDIRVSEQLIDISIRVPSIRPALVKMCLASCGVPQISEEELLLFKKGLSNCIWIIGEFYDDYIEEDLESDAESDSSSNSDSNSIDSKYLAPEIVEYITKQTFLERIGYVNFDKTVTIYIQSIAKVFSKFCRNYGESEWSISQFESVKSLALMIINWLIKFENSPNFEVQERALSFLEILKLVEEAIASELENLKSSGTQFATPPLFLTKGYNQLFLLTNIKPVGVKTQQKVIPPVDLDLNESFNDQAITDFNILYTRLTLEDLDIDFEDNEEDDIEIEQDVDEHGNDIDLLDITSAKGYDEEVKDFKTSHDGDPFYISVTDEISKDVKEGKETDSKKKPKKIKKYKKEKILLIEDDDDNDIKESFKGQEKSQFVIDSSNLANVDLRHQDEANIEPFANEYYIEEAEEDESIKKEKSDEMKIEMPIIETIKKKTKKKIKKKMAVIE